MTTKERLSKYLKLKGISHYEFSHKTGLSNGYLNSGSNITSASLDIITNIYGDLNLIWLVKGIGPMILSENESSLTYGMENDQDTYKILNEDYTHWLWEESDEKLLSMTQEQLIEVNKLLRMLVKSKNETIQAKQEKITTLEQLIVEKDNSTKLTDELSKLIKIITNGQAKG